MRLIDTDSLNKKLSEKLPKYNSTADILIMLPRIIGNEPSVMQICPNCFHVMRRKNKMRMNDDISIDVKQQMCDKYCRYPFECKTQDELDAVCDSCPMNNWDGGSNEK